MTRIAIRTVVNVIAHPGVLLVHGGLVVRVAGDAREHSVVRRVGVAIAARGPFALVRTGVDGEPRMVEHSARPSSCVVAGSAGCREACGDVVRIRDVVVVGLVTGITIGRRACVLAANMAVRA